MGGTQELKDYLGIPRKEIPWFPIIDHDKCTSCGLCVSACKHGTYEIDDNKIVVVANPYHCEVFCESCKFQCPTEVISFPNRSEFKTIIKDLRVTYPPTD
ncbi:MAG TPA: 4Fe-4S binding protein [Pelolinea sp.]|nr:4Fe-4S binding protein [Pelolinea sp.]